MCKCCAHFITCIAVTLNVIFFILGIALFSGGILIKTKADIRKVLGDRYKASVPSIAEFVPEKHLGNEETVEMQKQADEFAEKGMKSLVTVVNSFLVAIIVVGIFTSICALLGIIALTCCKEKRICLVMYKILVITLVIPFIILLILLLDDSYLRGSLFQWLDEMAFKNEFVNRFFMAVVQENWKCCAVRSPVEYFCRDLYDYVCNAGCMTMEKIWLKVKETMSPPVCKREPNLVEMCTKMKALHTKEDCNDRLNEPKPITGYGQAMCKLDMRHWDKQLDDKNFLEEFSDKIKEAFKDFDPAFDPDQTSDNFKIFGSPLQERKMEEEDITARRGCGYALWTFVPTRVYINYAIIFCSVVILLLVFQIINAAITWSKKGKTELSSSSSSLRKRERR